MSARDWEALLGQARRAMLQARLATRFVEQASMADVPQGPRQHLESALRLAERQRHEVLWEVDCVRRALARVDTPVVLLKGAAYLAADLPPARGRLFADVDIMVDRRQLVAVENALFASGWISQERNAYNDRYYRRWMHELPPMRHVHRGTTIDLHHTITPPTSHFNVDGARLLEHLQPIAGHPRLAVLAPADMVLHSAAHLFQEGEFDHGLRDLLDMNDLLRHFSQRPDFWTELLDRADELRLQVPLSHALTHLERLFSTTAPDHLTARVRALDRSRIKRRMMTTLLSIALRPEHPSCDGPFSGLARWLLYIRSHWLRMPLHLLTYHLGRKLLMRLTSESNPPAA
ncbi:MAG: nucleotidyltransferase family protein [Betaproteobacteria bacterium]|nr:MAG: nucleotidyltransferase family protein [Betaproteobacteria bacterium]